MKVNVSSPQQAGVRSSNPKTQIAIYIWTNLNILTRLGIEIQLSYMDKIPRNKTENGLIFTNKTLVFEGWLIFRKRTHVRGLRTD